ncbi:hypothetical protein L596_003482 [Steinernema carpocapsae]|uniref:Ig-like domain-containing protein n=1 Tax=Steinernema carpocapsae TaxID=34508 RepID=A0A4V6I819_STECR|nr:hypothetical protein L596_003482 [Steinernema carpocapsae]
MRKNVSTLHRLDTFRDRRLGDGRVIETRLVSAPVHFKRARLTKFDDYEEQIIRVAQEQLTRIPCFGLPDVVPSPAIMWFEKEGEEGVHLGLTSERRFVITLSGLQIALVQPSDAGNYYCVVKNPYTNHTRRATKPTVLVVNGRNGHGRDENLRNTIVFPLEGRSPKNPIVIHASVGQTVLLECVTSHSSVKWTKGNRTVSIFEMDNPHRVYEKVWGNLRLRSLLALDSDLYVCHGVSPFASENDANVYARVYYQLYVHVPTTAQLNLEEEFTETWRLVCYAGQQFYEVPMVYLNGFPLIERSHILADGKERVAETNPLNVTLKSSTLTGTSVQCISRAAMVEAEVYGRGLERGDAINLFVDIVREEPLLMEKNVPVVLIDYNATVIATLSTNDFHQVPKPEIREEAPISTTQTTLIEEDRAEDEERSLVSRWFDFFMSMSPSVGLKFVVFLVSFTFAFCLLMLFCCLLFYHLKEWHDRRFSRAAKGKFLDTSQRIFNEQLLQRSRTAQEQNAKLLHSLIRKSPTSTVPCLGQRRYREILANKHQGGSGFLDLHDRAFRNSKFLRQFRRQPPSQQRSDRRPHGVDAEFSEAKWVSENAFEPSFPSLRLSRQPKVGFYKKRNPDHALYSAAAIQ